MKFLFLTWGSSGDLHPFLSLGQELLRRGHEVTLAGNPCWKGSVERAGVGFLPAGPEQRPDMVFDMPDVMSTRNFGIDSLRTLMKVGLEPTFRGQTDALLEVAGGYDVLVAHHFCFAAGVAAEKTGIPWVSVTLAPSIHPSAYSLPAAVLFPPFRGVLGRMVNRFMWDAGMMVLRKMVDPAVNKLRAEHGLAPIRNVVFEGTSPRLNIQLYSPTFTLPEPDWSAEKQMAGFAFWDPVGEFVPPVELSEFLNAGAPPLLFTLGTSAVGSPGDFYREAVELVRDTSDRALLLIGDPRNRPLDLPANVLALDYAPYGWLMPRCRVVAHQCGIGTLSQTMRAGLPSLCCPYAFDQPNNAIRTEQLGVGVVLKPGKRKATDLRRALEKIEACGMVARAKAVGEKLRGEDGPARAAELLEGIGERSTSKTGSEIRRSSSYAKASEDK